MLLTSFDFHTELVIEAGSYTFDFVNNDVGGSSLRLKFFLRREEGRFCFLSLRFSFFLRMMSEISIILKLAFSNLGLLKTAHINQSNFPFRIRLVYRSCSIRQLEQRQESDCSPLSH